MSAPRGSFFPGSLFSKVAAEAGSPAGRCAPRKKASGPGAVYPTRAPSEGRSGLFPFGRPSSASLTRLKDFRILGVSRPKWPRWRNARLVPGSPVLATPRIPLCAWLAEEFRESTSLKSGQVKFLVYQKQHLQLCQRRNRQEAGRSALFPSSFSRSGPGQDPHSAGATQLVKAGPQAPGLAAPPATPAGCESAAESRAGKLNLGSLDGEWRNLTYLCFLSLSAGVGRKAEFGAQGWATTPGGAGAAARPH